MVTNALVGAAAALLTANFNAVELPTVEVEAFFDSRKVERGMVENPDPVYGWGVGVEWYGLRGGFEACYDMTDTNGRKGRYNELATTFGYGFAPFEWFEVGADYIYKHEWEGHTQEIELGVSFPNPWVVPYASWNVDAQECAGALYGAFGVYRDWELLECLTLNTELGMGYGNAKRNEEDFGYDRNAARDIHASLALAWEICEGLKLVPHVRFYDQFTKEGRAAFDNGFFVVAGAALSVEF